MLCGKGVEEQDMVKNIIDSQFKDTQNQYMAQLLGYFAGFLIPFIIQIFTTNRAVLIICLICCLLVTFISCFEEVLKIRQSKCKYFLSLYNLLNFIMVFVIFIFFAMKCSYAIRVSDLSETNVYASAVSSYSSSSFSSFTSSSSSSNTYIYDSSSSNIFNDGYTPN